MRQVIVLFALAALFASAPGAAISRDPNGVNVNSQGATTVFITFGGLRDQVPVEATWCGELVPATPDIGFKCNPATIFGRLPIRFDRSTVASSGAVFTDIMSIPPSVARRAYQAAERGENSAFFYVRRFASLAGGPDEYVFVTCRMAGGGARVPLALLDVRLAFASDDPVLAVKRGAAIAPFTAEIAYNGTGRLVGRWEVVIPGDDPPVSRDLLTEATLPPDERPLQRRYTLIERFNVFLPPTGRMTLEGPSSSRFPSTVEGLYQILLRVEASDDKEADSNLALAGAGSGIVHAGAVAGFPLPTLRYFVGSASDVGAALAADELALVAPTRGARVAVGEAVDFSWSQERGAALYLLEVENGAVDRAFSAILQQGIGAYRAPAFRIEQLGAGALRWRVVSIGPDGEERAETEWRELAVGGEGEQQGDE